MGTYWVNEWTCKDGAKTKYTGSEAKDYTVALSDFVNKTIPGYNASNGSYAQITMRYSEMQTEALT